ncbi:hypothetical protein F5X96DRAFT_666095 [Biscogniauxia mediterranea]|nr:hypothetical protein F5X96DRAFT_666095 [Biscogniauxia mediterranea]
MAMTVRPGQFVLSGSSRTEALSPVLSSSECVSSLPTGIFVPIQGGTPDPATTSDTVATRHATAVYPQGTSIDSSTDSVPTTFKTAIRSPRSTAPSSPNPAVRLVGRSASENSTAIGAGVGGGLGGALLLGLGIFLFIRYRKKRITTEAEDGKAVSPEPQQQQEQQAYYHHHHQLGYDDSQPKPECTPSPISGPEVYKESASPSLSDRHEHTESTASGPVELEAAPVSRAMAPSLQGDGHYTDRGSDFAISEAPAPVPVELPGTEVSIAELESPHLTATSPATTTITVLSTAPTITTATTATTPTVARASSSAAGRGAESTTAHHHHHHHQQQQQPPRTPASLISRAISPSPSVFSYTSVAPSEIHSLNEDAPRVLNAEERRRQLVALQEEARRREEGSRRRI